MYVLHYDKDFEIIWYTQFAVDLLIYNYISIWPNFA